MKHVLFVCVHNAGRSQMAEAILRARARERGIDVVSASAGTLGGGNINPMAALALQEIGLDLEGHWPKQLTPEIVGEADLIISMGCGVDADACPAKFLVTEDWGLDDPAGQPIEMVRTVRDAIETRVGDLLDRLETEKA